MFSTRQNESFVGDILNTRDMLEGAKTWIQTNLDPDDIWADDDLLGWVQRNYDPETVFPDTELARWAKNNGYVKADEATP